MSAESRIRVGIVGANPERGWARDAHIPALQSLAHDFELVAVSARTQDTAEQARALFGARKAFGDSLQLVRDPQVDLVAVTVKVPEHRLVVLSALAAGKHVYCEWPLGRTVAEAEEMAAAATAGRSHVMIGLQALSAPAVVQARKIVSQGGIGKLHAIHVYSPTAGWGAAAPAFYAYLQDKRNGATLETIAGGHTLAVMEELAGPFRELHARCSIRHPQVRIDGSDDVVTRTCADHMLVDGRHHSGCVSTLEVVGGVADKPFSLQLNGDAGWIRISSERAAGGFQVGNLQLQTSSAGTVALHGVVPALQGPPANIAESYARFLADIRTGSRTVPDFERAVQLSRLLAKIETAQH